MKSMLRATVLLGGSSFASILLSLAATKVLATILHPAGYGYYGLLQSFLGVASMLAGMGMATGIVRLGATAASAKDEAAMAKLCAGAWLLFAALGSLIMAGVVLCSKPLSQLALGSAEHQGAIMLMGIALLFTAAINVQNGILNAQHRVEALAVFGVANACLSAATSIVFVSLWRVRGVAPAVVGGAIASWAVSRWLLGRNVTRASARPSFREIVQSASGLLMFGIPFTASTVLGSGVQLALPMVVLHLLNTEAVAYYKAAAAVSVGYLGFLVNAMGQDYYPRLSAVREQPKAIAELIHEQYSLVLLVAAPMVLGTLALVPLVVPLIYSRRFEPAVQVLEWQLIGDLFKFSSWTMSFAVLARCKPFIYFCTESLSGAVTLFTAWLGVRLFGLAGLGIAFVATYAIYYVVVRTVLRLEVPVREPAANVRLMLAALSAAFVIRILPATPFAKARTIVALGLAMSFALYSLRVLRREYLAGREPQQQKTAMAD